MIWFYAADGKQTGPFTDEQFQELIAAGKVQPTTLVWQQKLPNWIPLAQLPVGMLPPSSTPPDPSQPPLAASLPRCANCGGQFSADNLVQIENALICPNCKPTVLHRIKEGFHPLQTAVSADELVHRIASENRTVDALGCFKRAWELFKADFGPMIGVSLLVFVIMMAGGSIPFIGSCISLVITGPLFGGLYFYYLKKLRNQPATVNDAFSGFKTNFMQLMLASTVTTILCYLPLLPFGGFLLARNINRSTGDFQFGVLDGVLLVVGMIVMLYLFMAWMFTIPLVMDKNMNFWIAMSVSRRAVMKRLGSIILLMLASMAVTFAGVLACFIGVLFAIPLMFTAYAVAYEDLFGDAQPAAPATFVNG